VFSLLPSFFPAIPVSSHPVTSQSFPYPSSFPSLFSILCLEGVDLAPVRAFETPILRMWQTFTQVKARRFCLRIRQRAVNLSRLHVPSLFALPSPLPFRYLTLTKRFFRRYSPLSVRATISPSSIPLTELLALRMGTMAITWRPRTW